MSDDYVTNGERISKEIAEQTKTTAKPKTVLDEFEYTTAQLWFARMAELHALAYGEFKLKNIALTADVIQDYVVTYHIELSRRPAPRPPAAEAIKPQIGVEEARSAIYAALKAKSFDPHEEYPEFKAREDKLGKFSQWTHAQVLDFYAWWKGAQ